VLLLRRLLVAGAIALAAALLPGAALAQEVAAPVGDATGPAEHQAETLLVEEPPPLPPLPPPPPAAPEPPSGPDERGHEPPPQWVFTLPRQETDDGLTPPAPGPAEPEPDPEPEPEPEPERGEAPAKVEPAEPAEPGPRPGALGVLVDYTEGFSEGAAPYVMLSSPMAPILMSVAVAPAAADFGIRAAQDPDAAVEEAKQFAVDTGKDMVAWDDFAAGRYARAAGKLTPDVAVTLLTGGLGRVAKVGTTPVVRVAGASSRVATRTAAARLATVLPDAAVLWRTAAEATAARLRVAGEIAEQTLREAAEAMVGSPRLALQPAGPAGLAPGPAPLLFSSAPAKVTKVRPPAPRLVPASPRLVPAPPAPRPGPAGPFTRVDPANVLKIRDLGGSVDYGTIDPVTGQRSGIKAVITPQMVIAASDRELGSVAKGSITPPGWNALPKRNRARGHLYGRQLGGSGADERNLVSMYQSPANGQYMSNLESLLAWAIRIRDEVVEYSVVPVYRSPRSTSYPVAMQIKAVGAKGISIDVEIPNQPWTKRLHRKLNRLLGSQAVTLPSLAKTTKGGR
jgi:hypothetical protein